MDSGLRGSRALPSRPSPDAAWALRYSVDAVGIDDRDQPVDERDEVEDEDRGSTTG